MVVYLAALGVRPLMRHDEFRYAEIPREMLASGDYVAPRINGLRYFEKPVMAYWLGAASQSLFGETHFAVRLVSALSTGVTALFLGFVGARLSGDRRTGLLAVFIFLTTILIFAIGTFDVPDPLLMMWLTLAIGAYLWAASESRATMQRYLLILSGAAAGGAFLTKGFLGFVVPGLALLPAFVQRWRHQDLARFFWWPVLVAIAVALPWSVLIDLREPDFWNYFFVEQHLQRFASVTVSRAQPVWFYLMLSPALLLPWTFLVPAAGAGLRSAYQRDRHLVLSVLAWFALPFAFYSIASAKLVTYILPCFPPLALLLAIGLRTGLGASWDRLVRRGGWALLGFYALVVIGLVLNQFGLVSRPLFSPDEWLPAVAVFASVALGGFAAAWGARRASRMVRAAGVSAIPICLVLPFVMPARIIDSKMPEAFLRAEASITAPDAILVSTGTMVRSVDWVFRRSDALMLDAGELGMGLDYADAADRLVDPDRLHQLVSRPGPHPEILIIGTDDDRLLLESAMADASAEARLTAQGEYLSLRIAARPGLAEQSERPATFFAGDERPNAPRSVAQPVNTRPER